ncbi:uncharacterized protein [Ranitomeya imitator]|uniref:uncharacterized protein n=1 Tax=Ranitomeya imitator TaxID=111125 RepID=UPI0037E8F6C7
MVTRSPPMVLEGPKPPKIVGGPARNPAYHSSPGARCHTCRQLGHLQRQCPNRTQHTQWPKAGTATFCRAAVHCYQGEADPALGATTNQGVEGMEEVLHEVDPVQAAQADNRQQHRQVMWVNGKRMQGLRDSGATLTLVKPHLVRDQEKMDRTVAVRVAGGAIHRLPTARIHLNWGVGDGLVEVGLMEDLPADVLLGNDLGPMLSAFSVAPLAETYPVTTRRQARAAEVESHSEEAQTLLCLDWGSTEPSRAGRPRTPGSLPEWETTAP